MPFRFSHVCKLLSDLERLALRDPPLSARQLEERKRQVTEYWFRCHRNSIDRTDLDGVALLSTLFPEKRTDRVYALQEARLCKVISRCLHLNISKSKALLDWKTPGCGDLGQCVEKVLLDFDCEPKPGSFVTVEEVDRALQNLASRCRFSGPEVRSSLPSTSADEHLESIFKRVTSVEAKWLTRLILKNFSPVVIDYACAVGGYHFLLPSLLRFQDSFSAALSLLRGPLSKYHSKPDLHSQKIFKKEAATLLIPRVGVKVGRQTFFKARSLDHCLGMAGNQVWSVERKYDGEYCEIHVDLDKGSNNLQIFSKSNKDSTQDRKAVHSTLRECLRIGKADCIFKRRCIVVGELVVWSDTQKKILEFHKIRKHVSRSGVFLGTDEYSQIRDGEHLMVVFFDVLIIDDEILLQRPYSERRERLKQLIQLKIGYAITAERTKIDFSDRQNAQEALCCQFAAALSQRCEGLLLKPWQMPYFRFDCGENDDQRGYVIKLKKDYLQELGGLRDVVDFAVVGASFDPKLAHKSNMRGIQYTTFHLGCCTNKEAAIRFGELPAFEIVGMINLDRCIPKPELQALNDYGRFRSSLVVRAGNTFKEPKNFDVVFDHNLESKMDHLFIEPCVVEVLGSGYEKPPNKPYFMLRHPRILKLHLDRSWRDTISTDELKQLADAARNVPVDGESQEMSQLMKKFMTKFERKAERDRLLATPTPRSETGVSSGSTEFLGTGQENKEHTPSQTPTVTSRRSVGKKSPILIRVDTKERHPGEPELVSTKSSAQLTRGNGASDSLPSPPPSSALVQLGNQANAPTRIRSSQQIRTTRKRQYVEERTGSAKRQKTDEISVPPIVAAATPVTDTSHDQRFNHLPRLSYSNALSDGNDSTSRLPRSNEPGVPKTGCQGARCPFAKSTLYLSSCISNFKWVSENLTRWHSAEQVEDLSHWQRETLRLPPLAPVVAESMAWPGFQKLVLVEPNRVDATLRCVEEVKTANIKDLVLFFDWRVLEDWKEAESGDRDEVQKLGLGILEKRYFGFTTWSIEQDKVIFLHRDLAKMPKRWLIDC